MLNKTEVYVCHTDTDIQFVGSKAECVLYKNSRNHNVSSWKINNLDGYGYWCYEEGREGGYSQGFDEGYNLGLINE